MNRKDLQQLALTRLAEAEALLAAGFPSGAYYLAGYAVECALKARIASFTQQFDFPDKEKAQQAYTHRPDQLIGIANLQTELNALLRSDADFAIAWQAITNWREISRYQAYSQEQADELLTAINHADYGVLSWLKIYW